MKSVSRLRPWGRGLCCLALVTACLPAQDAFKDVESRISDFTLKNGMKFIVLERHQAPVAFFYTYADVGSAQEISGANGLAHMFEHMAFKGTPTIGSKNYAEEKLQLDQVDQAFFALRAERDKGTRADPEKLKQLAAAFQAAQETAGKLIQPGEFDKIIDQSGGRGLNASTSADKTDYFFSLPSNSTELWFYLESERFRQPVFREFYKERDVVKEERRMRVDSQPFGKLLEDFLAVSFKAHPYGRPTIGFMSDLDNFSRPDAEAFFCRYYIPSNLVSVIVGDVDPKQMKQLAEAYFERIPSAPKPDPVRTVEPLQDVERRVILRAQAQRVIAMGYHVPAVTSPDNPTYQLIGGLLSNGRSSRLYKSLVNDQKLAVQAASVDGYPGDKYPNLFIFYALTAPGHTNEEVEKSMDVEINRLKNEKVGKEELDGIKQQVRAGLILALKNNSAMASLLSRYQVLTGDWHNAFRELERINKVTPEDVQRVAKATFTNTNRTVATIEPQETASAQ